MLAAFLGFVTFLGSSQHAEAAPPLSLSAWVVPYNPLSATTFVSRAGSLAEAMVVYLSIDANGVVRNNNDWNPGALSSVFAAAKAHKVKLYATISNADANGFDPARMTKLLHNTTLLNNAINDLTNATVTAAFQGVDLDIESMVAADRQAFSRFVQLLAASLHRKGKRLSVTVHPKTSEPGTWDGPQAQDWKALGAAADVIRPMCYDYSWSTSPVGPIAPTDWVVQVAKFAASQVGAGKVNVGVAWYGYDWKVSPALSLTFLDLPKTTFQLDPLSGERICGTTIRFAGAESMAAKLAALKPFRLTRFSAWYCGSGDPAAWNLVGK